MGLGLEYYYMSNWNHSLWIPCSIISHARSMHPNPVVRSTIPQQVNQDINKKLINFSVHWNYGTKILIGNVGCNLTIIKRLVVMQSLWISCSVLSHAKSMHPNPAVRSVFPHQVDQETNKKLISFLWIEII